MDHAAQAASSRGRLITFEGPDGGGKTTQIARLADWLRDRDIPVVTTREPGGSPGAEAIRHIVLSGAAERMGAEMEAILFAAARRDHVLGLIEPALRSGAFVLSDRYIDSTRAYQGTANGVDEAFLVQLERATVGKAMPDLTFVLDLPTAISERRLRDRRGEGTPDRFEKDHGAVQEARRQAFLDIARREPQRCVVLDAQAPVGQIADQIASIVLERFGTLPARVGDQEAG